MKTPISESEPATLVPRGPNVDPHQVTQVWQWWNKEIAPWRGIILGRWEAARFDSMPTLQQWYTAKFRYATIYCIPMKWEPEGPSVTWCEGSLSTAGSLVLKGVPHSPLSPQDICAMWARSPDRWSPNCPLVLQSMLPSIVNKALVLCSAPYFRVLNIQALVQGCGFKSYPWAWWWITLRVRLRTFGLISEIQIHRVRMWYNEGKQKAGRSWEGPCDIGIA